MVTCEAAQLRELPAHSSQLTASNTGGQTHPLLPPHEICMCLHCPVESIDSFCVKAFSRPSRPLCLTAAFALEKGLEYGYDTLLTSGATALYL